jgi:bifunctional non-homologous end joining protein LigD
VLDGRSLLRAKYRDRRRVLETFAEGTDLIVPDCFRDGPEALEYSRKKKWEGVVAKVGLHYQPAAARRRDQGQELEHPGSRDRRLAYRRRRTLQRDRCAAGRDSRRGRSAVRRPGGHRLLGEGSRPAERSARAAAHRRIALRNKAFRPRCQGCQLCAPELVGEVRYSEWTSDGRLRHPSWRGLRPDKQPADVVREVPV